MICWHDFIIQLTKIFENEHWLHLFWHLSTLLSVSLKLSHSKLYHISSVIRQSFFFLPKQSQRSRSILEDRSRSLGLFRKGKIGIIAKFHKTDLVI